MKAARLFRQPGVWVRVCPAAGPRDAARLACLTWQRVERGQ